VLGWLVLTVTTPSHYKSLLAKPKIYKVQKLSLLCEVSGFCHSVNEVFAFLGCNVVLTGS
jgi:hypothetical protein